jgi:hypothetical protein
MTVMVIRTALLVGGIVALSSWRSCGVWTIPAGSLLVTLYVALGNRWR